MKKGIYNCFTSAITSPAVIHFLSPTGIEGFKIFQFK